LITFNVDEHDDEYIEQRKELEPHQKHFSVFMEPRSMLLFSEDVYHHYLHSIEEEESTTLTEDKNILNLDQLKGLELGSTIQRTKRVSLTYRIVKRTISKNKWIRL
jgi:alkylated DNA repair protein alkB family protein 6